MTAQNLINLLVRKPDRKITENIIHYWFVMYGTTTPDEEETPEQPSTNS